MRSEQNVRAGWEDDGSIVPMRLFGESKIGAKENG